jgi:hypothetical protein
MSRSPLLSVATALTCLAAGMGAFFAGRSGGPNLAVITHVGSQAGAQSGIRAGSKAGGTAGYRAGYSAGYHHSYPVAYHLAYRRAASTR